jgi:hypothetical protein
MRNVLNSHLGLKALLLAMVPAVLLMAVPAAHAAEPWWHLASSPRPASLAPGSEAKITVTANDLGDAPAEGAVTPVTIVDHLPAGLKAKAIKAVAGPLEQFSADGTVECELSTLTCKFAETLPAYQRIAVFITVEVAANAKSPGVEYNEATVAGGGGATVTSREPLTIGTQAPQFGVRDYELRAEEEGGAPDTQAGSHPFQLTSTLTLNEAANPTTAPAFVKDLHFNLPAGVIGNPTPFPQCTITQFTSFTYEGNLCPTDTQVGVAIIHIDTLSGIGVIEQPIPLFNLTPQAGEPARFGFIDLNVPVYLDTAVRTGDGYNVLVEVNNITQSAVLFGSTVSFWGVPADPAHNSSRGWRCLQESPCEQPGLSDKAPLLSLPTACTGPLQSTVTADSWAKPEEALTVALREPLKAMDGCDRLPFSPSISVTPDVPEASTSTGLTVDVRVPQTSALNPEGLAESSVRGITLALPPGVAVNPSGANGLEACSESLIGYLPGESVPAANEFHFTPKLPGSTGSSEAFEPGLNFCSNASKIGTVKITTPLLPNPLEGAVYLAAQNANPFGSLIALYIVAEDPASGSLVKLPLETSLNQVTGQVTATLQNSPQLPFEEAEFHLFGGERAPLATPSHCGSYTTAASIVPWSGNEAATPSSTFDISSGPNGSACESPLLFDPSLTAGTTSIQAGAFSPFTMTVSREDGQQNIGTIQLHMPAGLSGLLTGVELCGEAQADAGTCGPNSLIGETTVSVGLGGDPYSVTGGKVYITGPYQGAPFGLSIVVPAKAGPYNLGQVVVRGTIEVNPITAALTVTTNSPAQGYAIPHILDGIPLQIKHVNFTTTRSAFTFNPTDCDAMGVTGSIASAEGSSSAVSVPFQVTNCAVLGFKPGFKVSTSGKTSRANGASLNVKLTYPKAPFGSQANIKSVKVDLPKQLPSRLTTLQKACPAKTFEANPAGCPADSIVGHATAITPLIPVPLTGPAYFVSYGGAKFPELVIVLQGYGVTLDLHGETFISKAGITSSTFHTVPDAPVGSFELTLPEGPFSALAANGNLCKSKLAMPTLFDAQNGAVIKQSTPISVTGCSKVKKKGKKASHKGKSHGKKK